MEKSFSFSLSGSECDEQDEISGSECEEQGQDEISGSEIADQDDKLELCDHADVREPCEDMEVCDNAPVPIMILVKLSQWLEVVHRKTQVELFQLITAITSPSV